MNIFDIFTNKAALEDSESFLGALDTGLEAYKQEIESMPAFRPAVDANGNVNQRQLQYAQSNMVPDGSGGFYSPERNEKLQKYNQLQAVKDQQTAAYERKLNNPLFNIKDLGADIFRNTVGLIPNMMTGSSGYDPSQRETDNYKTRMGTLVASQQNALSELTAARRDRATAFIGGIRKPVGTAVVDNYGQLGIPTTDTVDGGVRFDPILRQDGSVVGKPKNTVVALGGGGQGLVDLSSPNSPVQTVVSSEEATSADATQAGAVEGAKVASKIITTSQAEEYSNLASNKTNYETVTGILNRVRNHAGLDAVLSSGMGKANPNIYIPNTPEYDFMALLAQLDGTLFMQAYAGLKGGGQITEIEGKKATQQIANLAIGQGKDQWLESLGLLDGLVEQRYSDSRKKAAELNINRTQAGVLYRVID